jgi:hypothetical protein
MMDDYVFLEDVGRRVSEWGQDIVRGSYGTLQSRRGRGRGEFGQGKPRERISRKKRDVFKLQLDLRDIEVDLLPIGMQRRMLNQSTWDPKCVEITSLGATYYHDGSHRNPTLSAVGRGQLF